MRCARQAGTADTGLACVNLGNPNAGWEPLQYQLGDKYQSTGTYATTAIPQDDRFMLVHQYYSNAPVS